MDPVSSKTFSCFLPGLVAAPTTPSLKRDQNATIFATVSLEESPLKAKRVRITNFIANTASLTLGEGKRVSRNLFGTHLSAMSSLPAISQSPAQKALKEAERHPLATQCTRHPNNTPELHKHVEGHLERIFSTAEVDRVELSLLLNLLDHHRPGRSFPEPDQNLLEYRRDEVMAEISEIKTTAQDLIAAGTSNLLPDTALSYLLRVLPRTLYSNCDRFSEDTVTATLALFQTSIRSYFLPEQQTLILKMLEHMQKNTERYSDLFNKIKQNELSPHRSLIYLLCLDWQVPQEHYSHHIMIWALLKAFLTPCDQIHGPCCYAVAPLNTIHNARPFLWISTLVTILCEGSVLSSNGRNIPLSPFLSPSLIEPELMQAKVPSKKIDQIPVVARTKAVLAASPSAKALLKAIPKSFIPQDTLVPLSEKCVLPIEKEYLSAYLTPALNALFVKAGQTLSANFSDSELISKRDAIIRILLNYHSQFTEHDTSIDTIKTKLEGYLSIEETIYPQKTTGDSIETAFSSVLRIIIRSDTKSTPIFTPCDTFEILETQLRSLFSSFRSFQTPEFYKKVKQEILAILPISIKKIIQKTGMDICAIPATGGYAHIVFNELFKLSGKNFQLKTDCPTKQLYQLHNWVISNPTKTLCINTPDHVCTLMSDFLLKLDEPTLNTLIEKQKTAKYGCRSSFESPLKQTHWEEVCKRLDWPNSEDLQQAMTFTGTKHPYALATDVYLYAQRHDYKTDSFHKVYYALCDVFNVIPLIPLYDSNWRTRNPLDQSSFACIAVGYHPDPSVGFRFCSVSYEGASFLPKDVSDTFLDVYMTAFENK